MRKKGSIKGYVASRRVGETMELIYCEDGNWHARQFVGPGGYGAKVYKTVGGLKRARLGNVDAKYIEE